MTAEIKPLFSSPWMRDIHLDYGDELGADAFGGALLFVDETQEKATVNHTDAMGKEPAELPPSIPVYVYRGEESVVAVGD